MTDKENEAISKLNNFKTITVLYGNTYAMHIEQLKQLQGEIETVLNIIQTQQEEIEYQIEKRNNQKEELAILNEKQKEFNKLTNTVKSYKGMFKKQQEEIEKKKIEITALQMEHEHDVKMIDEVKGEAVKLYKEIKKKDKIIDLMAEQLVKAHGWFYSEFDNYTQEDFKEYFTKKVEKENK